MIDLYTWPTPNGFKVSILLEELGLPYNVIPVDIGKGAQFEPEYLKLNPNNKMPTIVDNEGPDGRPYAVMESGAILIYLADKHGKFLPKGGEARYDVLQWLMWQMGGLGPMLGQAHHFLQYAPEKIEYAMNRYSNEANRLYGVLNKRLQGRDYVAGDYSIADMAIMPWLRYPDRQGVDIEQYPEVKRWRESLEARPAVQKGLGVLAEHRRTGPITDEQREIMFGAKQYEKR
ncbi:glutathione S-transferase family protein [Oceanibaculum nanhaiense]|uniref:glutathione S-transferase family protein n=1 Tax=Oceanibaculum nanhaiense TaxID=1909734 RepID=UPI000A3C2D7B|nr:glutathione S-transferase N-terminal domain-containing protein [Oceanibaculum nanhaiense]